MIALFTRVLAVTAVLLALAPATALARPLYFQNLTNIYGLLPDDELYACGVCHNRWGGTGARNPYGLSVEQQLYLGKSIVDAILDIEGDDADGDGFLNGDELATHRTLPGYSCANFDAASDTPPYFQSIITPGVPSCLEPKDVRITPTSMSLSTKAGTPITGVVTVRNNGSDFPIEVTSFDFVPGAHPSLTLSGPATPFSIPVGASETIEVSFDFPSNFGTAATLRIVSDDPDEGVVDVSVSALAVLQPVAPPAERGACLKDIQKNLEKLTRTHLREWGTCYLAELSGIACNAAVRDLRIGKAEAKFRAVVGGTRDRRCAAEGLSAGLLGMPSQCPAPCDALPLTTMTRVADCLVCQQTAATNAMLEATVGTVPPDMPATVLGSAAHRCSQQIVAGVQTGIRAVQKAVGNCELAAVLSDTDVDCVADLASTLQREADKVDLRFERCTDTTGMEGCRFEVPADPACLGTTATQLGTTLAESVFFD